MLAGYRLYDYKADGGFNGKDKKKDSVFLCFAVGTSGSLTFVTPSVAEDISKSLCKNVEHTLGFADNVHQLCWGSQTKKNRFCFS